MEEWIGDQIQTNEINDTNVYIYNNKEIPITMTNIE